MSFIKNGSEQTAECGEILCKELLDEFDVDVIFADDDNIYSGVFNGLKKRKIDLTKIKLIRIGGWSKEMKASSISIPYNEMGKAAAELIRIINLGETPRKRDILIPCKIDLFHN